jgi:hypothetical protein
LEEERVTEESQPHECGDECSVHDAAFWARIERLNAEADDDVRNGRVRPVTDEFIAELRAIVTRSPSAGG